MLQELNWLEDLQEIDQELLHLREDLKKIEGVLDGVGRDRTLRAAVQQKRKQQIATAAADRRKLEGDLAATESKLTRFRQQQEQVRTAKEAEAMEHEVSMCSAAISALEEKILQLLETEEKLAVTDEAKSASESHRQSESEAEEKRLTTLKTEKEQLSKTLAGDRNAALNRLPEDLRDQYEWLVKRHGPTALVRVDKGACGGCGNMLVAQQAVAAAAGETLVQCPNCRRYLRA